MREKDEPWTNAFGNRNYDPFTDGQGGLELDGDGYRWLRLGEPRV